MAKKRRLPVDPHAETIQRLAGLAYQMPRPGDIVEALMATFQPAEEALCWAALGLRAAATRFVQHERLLKTPRRKKR